MNNKGVIHFSAAPDFSIFLTSRGKVRLFSSGVSECNDIAVAVILAEVLGVAVLLAVVLRLAAAWILMVGLMLEATMNLVRLVTGPR